MPVAQSSNRLTTHTNVTPEQLRELIRIGREHIGLEFKGHGSRADKAFLSQVARAVLAMANTRDGGTVLIGVNERTRSVEGLSDAELASWLAFDEVHKAINRYADPFVDFSLTEVRYDGDTVIAIRVSEFSDVPVLCKLDGAETGEKRKILRRGACYVRGRTHGVESVEVPSHVEMRELLELATTKKVREFVERASSVGLKMNALAENRYGDEQRAFENRVVTAIRAAPHWQTLIHPRDYIANRIDFASLENIVRRAKVNYGYDWFPDDGSEAVDHSASSVSSEYDFGPIAAAWRFYESGLFTAVKRSFPDETKSNDGQRPGLHLLEVVRIHFQVYEFAARVAQELPGTDPIVIDVQALQLAGRTLVEPPEWAYPRRPVAELAEWRRPQTVERTQLIGHALSLAKARAHELLLRIDPRLGDATMDKLASLVKS